MKFEDNDMHIEQFVTVKETLLLVKIKVKNSIIYD